MIKEGLVESDPWGSWSDCSPGIYLNRDIKLSQSFEKYIGKRIRITVEELPDIVPEDEETIGISLGRIIQNDEAIDFLGLNPYCVNEGADKNKQYQIPIYKAKDFGLI